ncbi:MAG: hypothetical protein WB699_09615 [Bacteroidota bacterium]
MNRYPLLPVTPGVSLLALDLRRWSASASWPAILLILGLATLPFALSPYVPALLPAMICGIVVAEGEFMDMFGSREREYLKFASLPVHPRALIFGKGISAMLKATLGALMVGTLHLWFAASRPAFFTVVSDALGFLAALPLLLQVGASASLQALRSPHEGMLDPIVRAFMLFLAGIICGIPSALLLVFSGSWVVLLLFALLSLAGWAIVGTPATVRSLDRWNHSPGYDA